jgi:hypothetical protein
MGKNRGQSGICGLVPPNIPGAYRGIRLHALLASGRFGC